MFARHDTDVVSLVFGALFVGTALFWGLTDQGELPGQDWYLPVLLIVVGAVGLFSARGGGPDRAVDSS